MSTIIDLQQLIRSKIDELGPEKAAKFFNKGVSTIQKWMSGNTDPTVGAAQAVLADAIERGIVTLDGSSAAAQKAMVHVVLPDGLKAIFGNNVNDLIPEWLKTFREHGSLFVNSVNLGNGNLVINHGIVEVPTSDQLSKVQSETEGGGDQAVNFQQLGSSSYDTKERDLDIQNPPDPQSEPKPVSMNKSPYAMIMPTNRDINFSVMMAFLANWKQTLPSEIQEMLAPFHGEKDTLIIRARNILATRFIKGDQQWSFWLDSDVIPPIGNPEWFKRKTGSKYTDEYLNQAAIRLLTKDPAKTIVGAPYPERSYRGRMVSSPGMDPRSPEEKVIAEEFANHGPKHKVVQVGWVGFGCVAVHRRVFEDMIRVCPDVKPTIDGEPYNFFGDLPGESGACSEDVSFARRAKTAGHPCWLHLGCPAAHVGPMAFTL